MKINTLYKYINLVLRCAIGVLAVYFIYERVKDDSLNDLSGIVSASVYQGESVLVMVDLGENTMISVRLPANKSQSSNIIPDVGKPIYLGLHAEDVIIVKGRVE